MNLTDLTYAVGEFCFYYALAWPVFQLFGCSGSFFPQAAVLLISELLCAAASRLKGVLRYLPLVLILPALLIGHTVGLFLLGAPLAILVFLRTKAGSFHAEYDSVHRMFFPSLWIYALIVLLALVSGKGTVLAQVSLPLYIVWLLSAVLCMRLLRITDRDPGLRYRLMNIILLVLIAGVGFILSCDPVTSAAAAALRAVYLYFIAPLLFIAMCIIAAVPAAVFYGIYRLISLFGSADAAETEQQTVSQIEQVLQESGADAYVTPEWLTRCAAAAGILLFLLAAYLIARRFVGARRSETQSASYLRRETVADRARPKHREPLFSSSQEDAVRKCYRKYLALCRSYRIPTDGSLASDAVLQESSFCAGTDDASELRRLWLPVRYGNAASSPEAVKKAQSALTGIRVEAAMKEKALRNRNRT